MKTALTQLHERFIRCNGQLVQTDFDELFDVEKQQIIDSFQAGIEHGNEYFLGDDSYAQKYFNETFNHPQP